MTELHLVRHGKAGRRDQWDGPDDLPLVAGQPEVTMHGEEA